jgi:hypothetical protein
MYKALLINTLIQTFSRISAYKSAYWNETNNPQRFIHVTVTTKYKKQKR